MTTKLETLAQAVESAHADIAPEYQDYFMMANAIATDCGEAGRDIFHRLCRFSPKYRQQHADRIFDNMLRTNHNRVHLGTVFHLARQAGVSTDTHQAGADTDTHQSGAGTDTLGERVRGEPTPHTHTRTHTHTQDTDTLSGSDPTQALPNFTDHDWPEPISTILSHAATPQQRDALLLATLTVLGATLERKVRCLYGGKMQHPCMQTFIVAPPASGKGIIALLRHLALPIHRELRNKYNQELKAYNEEKTKWDIAGKNRADMQQPTKPLNRLFIISGNNSGTGILQNLMDADGTGLIFETEADTLSTAIGADYGHFSDTLRKAYDHDMIAYNRRMEQEYREVRKTYLSVLLSGTPAQVRPLIPDAENGLFSRQLFYYMPGMTTWQDQFDHNDTDLEPLFAKIGEQWKQRLDTLRQSQYYTLRLTPAQKSDFNAHFARLFASAGIANGTEMNSSIVRLATNTCRILSIIGVLRGEMTPDPDIPHDNVTDGIISRWDVTVNDPDFRAVLSMTHTLYRHASHILSMLPSPHIQRRPNSEWEGFFATLPDIFTHEQYYTESQKRNINRNTAKTWLAKAVSHGMAEHTDKRGEYRKTPTHTRV